MLVTLRSDHNMLQTGTRSRWIAAADHAQVRRFFRRLGGGAPQLGPC